MKNLLLLFTCLCCSSCTVSIMLTDSHGTDNDVESSPSTETDPEVEAKVPAKVISLKRYTI